MSDSRPEPTSDRAVTVTINGMDRRHIAAAVRRLARNAELLDVSLNAGSPVVQRLWAARRNRLTALANAIDEEAAQETCK